MPHRLLAIELRQTLSRAAAGIMGSALAVVSASVHVEEWLRITGALLGIVVGILSAISLMQRIRMNRARGARLRRR